MARKKGSTDKIKGGRKGKPLYFKANNPNRAYGRPRNSLNKEEKDAFGDWLKNHGKDYDLEITLGWLQARRDFLRWQYKANWWGKKDRQHRSRQRIRIPTVEYFLLGLGYDGKCQLRFLERSRKGKHWQTVAIVEPDEGAYIRERQIEKWEKRLESITRKLFVVDQEIEKLSVPVYVPDFQI